jgi:hypothetical protein
MFVDKLDKISETVTLQLTLFDNLRVLMKTQIKNLKTRVCLVGLGDLYQRRFMEREHHLSNN